MASPSDSVTTKAGLVEALGSGRFEFQLSTFQSVYYTLERAICERIAKRPPPNRPGPRLLNLGCGPHNFEGWINADDYAPRRRWREAAFKPDWSLDITRPWACPSDYWDGVFTEHVLEHLSYSEVVHTLSECLRTMRSGAWIRISVPDLRTYVDNYEGRLSRPEFEDFPHPAVGVSFVTQMHLHRSAWDADLMTRLLSELGFEDACVGAFGEGADARLLKDDPDKRHESLYVEARRP
jgi:predicted SAM-dependent methyltransferase